MFFFLSFFALHDPKLCSDVLIDCAETQGASGQTVFRLTTVCSLKL